MHRYLLFIIICLGAFCACSKNSSQPVRGFVCTSPETAEIICALGGLEQLRGVSSDCNYPPALSKITQVGGFGNLDLEKIIALQPQAVLMSGLEQNAARNALQKTGLTTYGYYPATPDSLYGTINALGLLLQKKTTADSLVASLKLALGKYRGQDAGPRVYVEIYNQPLMSCDSTSWLGHLVILAGGQNIFPKMARDYCRVENERVVLANPEVIILTHPVTTPDQVATRLGWENISAVKNKRIYGVETINPDIILRAGPRAGQGLEALHEAFRPR